jgi:2-hydroxy-3-keto-5-methylthiopentenyl-1-phosphate phosphatase
MKDSLEYGLEKRREGREPCCFERQDDIPVCKVPSSIDYLVTNPSGSDSFEEMLESVVANGHSFDECKEALKKSASSSFRVVHPFDGMAADIVLNPGFKYFYAWCKSKDIPIIIVSR